MLNYYVKKGVQAVRLISNLYPILYPDISIRRDNYYISIGYIDRMAEGEGFEPSIRFPAYTLSKRAPSATRPPLLWRARVPAFGAGTYLRTPLAATILLMIKMKNG